MNEQPENEELRVNKSGKYYRASIFDPADVLTQQPQHEPRVYIIKKEDFKNIVQQLTGCHLSCERLPHENPAPEAAINQTSLVPPPPPSPAITVQEDDPDVLLYMSYLERLLKEDSSQPNNNNVDLFHQTLTHPSHMLTQAHLQPPVPNQHMPPQSNGFEPVNSSWFNGSSQQMHGAYPLASTSVEYPQPLMTPNLPFSSMTQPGVLGLDDIDFESFYL